MFLVKQREMPSYGMVMWRRLLFLQSTEDWGCVRLMVRAILSCLEGHISVLLLSCFVWSGALDSRDLLLSYYNNTMIAHNHTTNNNPKSFCMSVCLSTIFTGCKEFDEVRSKKDWLLKFIGLLLCKVFVPILYQVAHEKAQYSSIILCNKNDKYTTPSYSSYWYTHLYLSKIKKGI